MSRKPIVWVSELTKKRFWKGKAKEGEEKETKKEAEPVPPFGGLHHHSRF